MDAKHHIYKSETHTYELGEDETYVVKVLPFSADALIHLVGFLENEHSEKVIPDLIKLIFRKINLGEILAEKGVTVGNNVELDPETLTESLIVLIQKVFPRLGGLALDVVSATIEAKRDGDLLEEDKVLAFLKKLCFADILELLAVSIELMSVERLQEVFTRLGACFKRTDEDSKEAEKPAPSAKRLA